MAQTRQLSTPAYLVGAALFLIPPFEAVMQTIPIRMSDPRWRFGFLGLISNSMMMTGAGLLILFIAADYYEHRRFQKALGILAIVSAFLFILMAGMFSLDVLQVRRDVKAPAQLAYKVASLTALAKWGLAILTFGSFGWAAFKAPKAPKATAKEKQPRASGLVVGRPSSAGAAALPAQDTAGAGTE